MVSFFFIIIYKQEKKRKTKKQINFLKIKNDCDRAFINNSPLLKNNGFGEGLSAMSFFAHANLTSPSACHRIYPFYRATFPFFFYLYFSSSFLFFFSFPFSFFIFPFFSFLFLFSFYFLFFYFFIFSPSFPPLFIFGHPFRGREERNNK
jgi:hypothetical protein